MARPRRLQLVLSLAAASALGGLLSAASVSCSKTTPIATAEAATPKAEQKVVVNLTRGTDDLHAAMMALMLARGMAERGATVTIFVNLEAVRLVDQRQPFDLTWGRQGHMTLAQIYDGFIKAGGRVLVCPHCAAVAGLTEKDLRRGASLGTEESTVELMLEADKILDY